MTRVGYQAAFAAMTLALTVACTPSNPPAATVTLSVEDRDQARARHLKEAMEVDSDFSAMAQTDGVGAAFAAYMDGVEGQLIQPSVVIRGEAEIRAAFADWPENVKLIWAPDGGYAAAEGDMAVTTGRFKRTEDDNVVGEGRYVTVWRKNGAGDWKGLIDLGAPDAPPAPPEDATKPKDGAKPPKKDKD